MPLASSRPNRDRNWATWDQWGRYANEGPTPVTRDRLLGSGDWGRPGPHGEDAVQAHSQRPANRFRKSTVPLMGTRVNSSSLTAPKPSSGLPAPSRSAISFARICSPAAEHGHLNTPAEPSRHTYREGGCGQGAQNQVSINGGPGPDGGES